MSEDELELKEDIKNFQMSLKSHIRSFRKRLKEPGSIQFLPKKYAHDLDEPYLDEKSHDYLLFKKNKITYEFCQELALPLSTSKIFRFLHLRIFSLILESTSQACHRKHPIEICFHLRSFLEHAANFTYALDEIIPMSKELLNNMKVEYEKFDVVLGEPDSMIHLPSDKFMLLNKKLLRKLSISSFQSNIDFDQILVKGKTSLVPDKSNPLKPISIRKKLEALSKKKPMLHFTYDYLSEYVHPNSYIFYSALAEESEKNYTDEIPYLSFEDLNLEDGMSEIVYFFQEHNRSFLNEITVEILERDFEFLSLQRNISKKMKVSIKKIMNSEEFQSDGIYSKALCVCGSQKKLLNCCLR